MSDNTIDAARLLRDLSAMRAAASGAAPALSDSSAPQTDFGALMLRFVNQVNGTQQQAASDAARFEAGARDVQLVDVMISMQKSRIAFEALTQVRNKLLSAYQEIMNMQV